MDDCKTVRSDKLIVLMDGKAKSQFRLSNPNQKKIHQILIDDCVIKQGKRCDYMIIVDKCKTEHYIELKGKNISHACMQLEETIRQLSSDSKNFLKYCFVVSSVCPLSTTKRQKLTLQFKKNYNAILRIKNKTCCFEI